MKLAQEKLHVAEKYSWYIINALMFKVQSLEKAIQDAEQALVHQPKDDKIGAPMYESMRNMMSHCEQSLKEHKEALEALRNAGFR